MTPTPAHQSTIGAVNGGPVILVTRRECWYFSHRNKLLRRGVSISTASFRAVRVAGYVERRWPEARAT